MVTTYSWKDVKVFSVCHKNDLNKTIYYQATCPCGRIICHFKEEKLYERLLEHFLSNHQGPKLNGLEKIELREEELRQMEEDFI